MLYFCTYFDIHYLSRALAMHNSLMRHCPNAHIYMLCFDVHSEMRLKSLNLPHVSIIPLEKFEAGDDELLAAKHNRTKLEYYFTCSPSLPLYIFSHYPEVQLITYLDADLFFFSDPQPLIKEMEGYSIAITVHNFPEYAPPPVTGKYNVGWLSFRRDPNALACLQWWREKCLEWCYDRLEDGRFADQLYLNQWPDIFQGIKILEHKGANVAAWNVGNYETCEKDGHVWISGFPLIFYHFHGFKQITRHVYNTNLGLTLRFPSKVLKEKVFKPYIMELRANTVDGDITPSIRNKNFRPKWIQAFRTFVRTIIGVLFRQYIVATNNDIY